MGVLCFLASSRLLRVVLFLQIGSTHPAAMLYDACVAFSEKSPKADENIRYIRGQNALDDAVLGEAARFCFVVCAYLNE